MAGMRPGVPRQRPGRPAQPPGRLDSGGWPGV